MEDLSTGHQLMLHSFNKYQKDFIPASLYLRWQVTFPTLFITVKVMQVRDPMASLYICQLGSQPAKNLFSITRTLNHRNFDVLKLQVRLQAVLDIQDFFWHILIGASGMSGHPRGGGRARSLYATPPPPPPPRVLRDSGLGTWAGTRPPFFRMAPTAPPFLV